MAKKYKYMKNQYGRSMIEMVGVLALMGLLTAGAFALIQSGMASQKRNRAVDEVAAIVANIRSMYATSDNGFNTLPTDKATGTRLIGAMHLNTETPFGDRTAYSVTRDASNSVDHFDVFLTGLEDDDCFVLAQQTWPDALSASCQGNGSLYLMFGM